MNEVHPFPQPQPLCLVYEPMLPLLAWHELDGESEQEVQAHANDCAWCQQRLREYEQLDRALQRHLGLDSLDPFAFNAEAFMDHFDTENEPHQSPDTTLPFNSTATEAQSEEHSPATQTSRAPTPRPRLQRRLSALGAVAAVLLVTLLAVTLFSGRLVPRTGSQPTPTVSVPTPTPVTSLKISVFSAPGQGTGAVVGVDGSLAYIVGGASLPPAANHPFLVYVSPTGTVTTFQIPSNPQAWNIVTLGVDGNGNILGQSMERVLKGNTTLSYANVTWLLDPRSGAIKDLPGELCLYELPNCQLGPDGFFWSYTVVEPSSAHPNESYPGTISRINPDTNQTVSQTPVPAWIQSHMTLEEMNSRSFGVGAGGITWFSGLDSDHFWLASFNVYTKALHTFELPGSFAELPGSAATQTVSPNLPDLPPQPIVAPDGSLWVAAYDESSRQTTMYHYSPDGQLRTFTLPDNWTTGPGLAVADQNGNLCTIAYLNYAGSVWDYQCLSPQGTITTLGTVSNDSIPSGAIGEPVFTGYDSIWLYGHSAVAQILFPPMRP